MKAQIIVHVMDYLENNDESDKKNAIEKLYVYANFYNLSPRRRISNSNIKLHLREFNLRNNGKFHKSKSAAYRAVLSEAKKYKRDATRILTQVEKAIAKHSKSK